MKEYLEEREQEVSDIMMILFDEETIRRNHEASVAREYEEVGIKNLIELCQSMGGSRSDAVENVINRYHRSKDAAVEIVQKYWKENQ